MEKTSIFINNRNRLSTLRLLVDWLRGKNNQIVILDNDSDYPPLMEYYKTLDCRVVMLGENMGNAALYKWGGHLEYPGRYFIYTDSDLLPKEDCPEDLVDYLVHSKRQHEEVNKVGASLEIRDIPDLYPFKKQVVDWESKFWEKESGEYYVAEVDTTFAAYDKLNPAGRSHNISNCLRTKRPYVLRHLPWYLDARNLPEEEAHYIRSANAFLPSGRMVGMWTQRHKKFTAPKLL
jgi:hypothetical protein